MVNVSLKIALATDVGGTVAIAGCTASYPTGTVRATRGGIGQCTDVTTRIAVVNVSTLNVGLATVRRVAVTVVIAGCTASKLTGTVRASTGGVG